MEKARLAHAANLERLAARTETEQRQAPGEARRLDTISARSESNHLPTPTENIFTELARNARKIDSSISVDLNERQLEAVERGMRGQSFVLIGAAGTGKTTTTQELIKLIQQASHMMPFRDSTKHLNKDAPGFVIVGYTNKAVNNLRKKLPPHLQSHCVTIHKLIEFAPEYFQVVDADGHERNTMRFTPSRNGANPLPHISTIILEESSMIGTDLYGQLLDALPRPSATQMIFLGDIFQLPPVFGPSILGFKMSELPVVELTHVYRQALESPIISLATAIRTDGFKPWLRACASVDTSNPKPSDLISQVVIDGEAHGKVTIRPWKKRLAAPSALKTIINLMTSLITSGNYNADEDQILCPFNKSFGTVEVNKGIADYLAKQRDAVVHEVIARYQRSYWAVGDRVMVDRHEAQILKIESTIGYVGKPTMVASKTLDRWGVDSELPPPDKRTADEILNELDAIAENEEEGKNLASHSITVFIPDLGEERKLTTAGEINSMIFSYCLTVHKSQGSEWGRVFILLHSSHQTMISRELLYTAITRAKQELYVICEGDVGGYKNQLLTGSNRAVIPGITLADKIEYFQGKSQAMKNIASND
jgi:ATP-dependent exoDNAse (exonuclease V) alpha subunit